MNSNCYLHFGCYSHNVSVIVASRFLQLSVIFSQELNENYLQLDEQCAFKIS